MTRLPTLRTPRPRHGGASALPAAAALAVLLAVAPAVLAVAGRPAAAEPVQVQAVDAVGITVSDLDRAAEFYSGVLGFEPVWETEVAGEERVLTKDRNGDMLRPHDGVQQETRHVWRDSLPAVGKSSGHNKRNHPW